ncbi:MAG: DUF4166 domain-containing protein [Gammaproteobacteria bacterium]
MNIKLLPIFQPVFGDSWETLPTVIKKHYANRPYCRDSTTVKGKLDIMCAGPFRWFAPLFWLMRSVPPINQHSVPVTVVFQSEPNTNALCFDRTFYFHGKKPYRFRSRMIPVKDNLIAEVMASRIAWLTAYHFREGKVILSHKGYALAFFGHLIPIPLTALVGAGYAEEIAIDDHHFDMAVHIQHPWFGTIYGYQGRFEVQTPA